MTRMIQRWFPCAEVSAAAAKGWGLGRSEKAVFTWFAARPPAQAKAAVVCSLLPWPDDELAQERLQDLVRAALRGRYAAREEVRARILESHRGNVSILDPFSGRGMIPLEAARLGLTSFSLDYAPVAVLASALLADFPFRDWSDEPPLPFSEYGVLTGGRHERLLNDVTAVLAEVGRRYVDAMLPFYPKLNGRSPWGYIWAVSLPCQECGRRFPLIGSYELRKPGSRPSKSSQPGDHDPGQSFYIHVDPDSGEFRAVVHDGPPRKTPTLASALSRDGRKVKGKAAICPFCDHAHPLSMHQRLANEGLGQDNLLVVADLRESGGKSYRSPTSFELEAAALASSALAVEPPFTPLLPALPNEPIPINNGATIRPQLYGARTYGDLMCARQSLGFIRLARIIAELGSELITTHSVSMEYARALTGYAAANLIRKIRYATRGATLYVSNQQVSDVFLNEGAIAFSYDFLETGIGDGPGTWQSLADNSKSTLRTVVAEGLGCASSVGRGTAADLPYRTHAVSVIVTDPPYDSMVYYTDSSDVFYVWLKRALNTTWPDMASTPDPRGLQEKADEIIVKEHGKSPGEHRTRGYYDSRISAAFAEMRRVVEPDGLVTIVFGHGEPEVWQRLLTALSAAGLVMSASWPANTEAGGQQGKANIETTLTMACLPAPPNRPPGRKAAVEAEIRSAIKLRYPSWERWGLAPTDMLMAAAGPAMEIVGRYSHVLDARGEPVDIAAFLPLARAAVQEAMAVEIDHHPLETFDARSRFALWWVRLYGKQLVAKSELRWQALASSMDLADVRDLVPDTDKGCRFISTSDFKGHVSPESSVIDVAFAMARASEEGLEPVGQTIVASGRDADDAYLWASIKFLADRLPDADPDAIAWTRLLRNRAGIGSATHAAASTRSMSDAKRKADDAQLRLL